MPLPSRRGNSYARHMTRNPAPIVVTASVEVAATPARAWAVVADYRYDAQWREGVASMEQSTTGTVADATRTVEDFRMLGQHMTNVAMISVVVPGQSFRWRTVSGTRAEGTRQVVALGEGRTLIRLETRSWPSGLVETLLRPLIKPTLKRSLDRSVLALKRLVES